ncbi:MAG: glycosyltransferase family 39 protein, partial [Pseudomonadota bacterium]
MASSSDALRAAWLFIAVVTLWRVAMLWVNRTDLFVDEAQYWAWGQHLDWGYFSKPPLIGWVIRAVTDILGADTPFAVRLAAPLFHMATALAVIWAARAFVDAWVAAWAGAIYVAMPLISIGSNLISTDTIMLPFFALALGLYGRLIERPSAMRAITLGAAIGAGLMAKYA